MDTKEILHDLRTKHGLSQEELAERVFVTRQAVSRWETGETTPNVETLKLLSQLFNVSINTLLGAPRQLVCPCCGMPLEDATTSKEPDGTFNEDGKTFLKLLGIGGVLHIVDVAVDLRALDAFVIVADGHVKDETVRIAEAEFLADELQCAPSLDVLVLRLGDC